MGLTAILLLLTLTAIPGCVTETRCLQKFGAFLTTTPEVIIRDTTVHHPGITVDTFLVIRSDTVWQDRTDTLEKVITKDRVRIRHVFVNDTVHVTVECPEDSQTVSQVTMNNQVADFGNLRTPESGFWSWNTLKQIFQWLGVLSFLGFLVRTILKLK